MTDPSSLPVDSAGANGRGSADDSSGLRPALLVPWWEIVAVIAVMLGTDIGYGAYYGMTHPAGAFVRLISDRLFLVNSAFESFFLAGFLAYLQRRGWSPGDLQIRAGWIASLGGAGLFALTCLGNFMLIFGDRSLVKAQGATAYGHLAARFVPHGLHVPMGSIHLSWGLLIGFTILNAFYEELVYMGYAFNLWAKKYGPGTAVFFTVLVRLAVHTYQGTEHLLQIGLWSLIFGLWYRYQRKVWPLIVAHMMTDFISLGTLKIIYGSP